MVPEGMGFDDGRQGRCVKSEENRAKDRSLWNTTGEMCWLRVSAIDKYSLFSVSEIGGEPGKGHVRDTKGVLESSEENSMIDGIEGCR